MNARALAEQLQREGHAILPALYDATQIDRTRAALARIHRELGAPAPYGAGLTWLADDVELSSTGFVVHKLLGFAPELARGLLPRLAVEVVRSALGDDMHLEMVAGVISDDARPFFEWHMHVGGIDDERYRREGRRPRFTSIERVAMLVYLDEMREETGQLLVYPRAPDASIDPPHPIADRRWPGQRAVSGPAGTAVIMDQSTWHAVLPRRRASPRMFVGFWFAAASATRAERVDESLAALEAPDAVLASVLARRPA